MAKKKTKAAETLDFFKYNPETDGDQTFNIDLALNQNWDKVQSKFESQDTEIEAVKTEIQNIDVSWSGISGKPETFPSSEHTHTKSQITDFPTSLPASDVYSWAKASSKPTYTASEVGALPTSGGTITGSIGYSGGGYNGRFIEFLNENANGAGVAIGCGGLTVLGSGESMTTYMNSQPDGYNAGNEQLVLTSDNNIIIRSGVQSGFSESNKYEFKNGDLYIGGVGLKSSVVSGKQEVVNAINGKLGYTSGLTTNHTHADYANWITNMLPNALSPKSTDLIDHKLSYPIPRISDLSYMVSDDVVTVPTNVFTFGIFGGWATYGYYTPSTDIYVCPSSKTTWTLIKAGQRVLVSGSSSNYAWVVNPQQGSIKIECTNGGYSLGIDVIF